MQKQPKLTIFDTTQFSEDSPVSPMGSIFTYEPETQPRALHYHDFFEIGYCERGSGIFNANGQPITFNGKCASIVYGGEPHIAISTNKEKSLWHFLYIDLHYLFARGNINPSFLKDLKANSWSMYSYNHIISYDSDPGFYNLCKLIIQNCGIGTPQAMDVVRGLVYSLLKTHESTFKPLVNPPTKQASISLQIELQDTINFIAGHFTEKITIDDLTDIAKMSQSNLQRKMIAYTGRSPLQYVQYVRMKHASVMLMDKNKSIAEIAMDLGYTISCFNRMFQKQFNMSPSRWRKENLI